jgi:formylglycine-generating enzyme required for sulfatase activity
MKLCFLILLAFLVVIAKPALGQQVNGPLGKDQVLDLLKFGLDSGELAKRIKERGIDFEPTDDYLATLRQAGAPEAVIHALREVRPKPLTREQVGQLVAGGVPSQRATMLVEQRGIDFVADERYLQTLRVAGGDDRLIDALREASAAVTGELVVETSPDAEVYLDGQLQGKAGAQGEFVVKAKPGAYALRVSLIGRKDFDWSITLAARQATTIQARLKEVGPSPGIVHENPKDGLPYVWIPPGAFLMGCSSGDRECFAEEKPAHHVTITTGFWMGQREVTVAAYNRFAGGTGRQMPPTPNFNGSWAHNNMPIVKVNWNDAFDYCTWAGGRLPTEAEWEYAARAGSTEVRYGALDEIAWYSANSGLQTHPVGEKRANGFGLFDILGNVQEWVNDWYGVNYYAASPERDPRGPDLGQLRVLRGGSWRVNPRYVRVSNRNKFYPDQGADNYGIRCAWDAGNP